MSLSLADIKRADVQSFRDVATALDGMAAANSDMKTGVGRLPIAGDAWKGVSGDAAHHELDGFGKLLEGSAEAKKGAAAKIRRAADEFEGVKQLLAKLEQDASKGKFKIDMSTGKVTPPSGDYDKSALDYLTNTLRQIMQAGDAANADLAAAVKAAKELPDPSSPAGAALPTTPTSTVKPGGAFGGVENLVAPKPDGDPGATRAAAAGADTQANYKEWYPKTAAPAGDKLTMDPSKAGSLTGSMGAMEKNRPADAPYKPAFGEGVARQFGKGVNETVDGTIQGAKNLVGLGGEGAPGVAESWGDLAKGTGEGLLKYGLVPAAGMIEDAQHAYNDPGHFAGQKLIEGASTVVGGGLGSEATALRHGLLDNVAGTETHGLTHGLDSGGDHGGGFTGPPSDGLPHIDMSMKDGWSDFQHSQMQDKVQGFNASLGDEGFSKTLPGVRDPAIRQLFLDTLGLDRVPPGVHVDHIRDLQAGGLDSVDNMGLLDGSVNSSFGSQLNSGMNRYPEGTQFGGVRLPDPGP